MSSEAKTVTAIIIITVLVVIGGIFVMAGQTTNLPAVKVQPDILIRPDSPEKVGADSKVTIVEFADYECPSCAALHPALKQLLDSDEGQYVTLVYRNFPLHSESIPASVAVQAAGAQGKYWEMNDIMFEKQDEWSALTDSDNAGREKLFDQYAASIGLDVTKFQQDEKNPAYVTLIKRDQADGLAMGVEATPTMIIDGQVIEGAISYAQLKQIVDAEIAKTSGTPTVATSTASTTVGQ